MRGIQLVVARVREGGGAKASPADIRMHSVSLLCGSGEGLLYSSVVLRGGG